MRRPGVQAIIEHEVVSAPGKVWFLASLRTPRTTNSVLQGAEAAGRVLAPFGALVEPADDTVVVHSTGGFGGGTGVAANTLLEYAVSSQRPSPWGAM